MKARLLFAGSHELTLELLQRFFEAQGYEVRTATDPVACVQTVQDFLPDVVILDSAGLWGSCENIVASTLEELKLSYARILVLANGGEEPHLGISASTQIEYIPRPERMATLLATIRHSSMVGSGSHSVRA